MTKTSITALLIILPFCTAWSADKTLQLQKVNLVATEKNKRVFLIEDSEIAVRGKLIKRIELGESSAVITYLNKTEKSLQPSYHFRLINAYGIEIAVCNEKWIFSSVGAGQIKKENVWFSKRDIFPILEFSNVDLPSDWEIPIYMIIEGYSN